MLVHNGKLPSVILKIDDQIGHQHQFLIKVSFPYQSHNSKAPEFCKNAFLPPTIKLTTTEQTTTKPTTTRPATSLRQPASEPKTTKKGLSIKDNLSNFQLPGIPGPLSWGFLSPFSSKEHCLVQYQARIPSKSFKIGRDQYQNHP